MAEDRRSSALDRHYERGTFGAAGAAAPAIRMSERRGLAMAQVNGAPEEAGPAPLRSLAEEDAVLMWTGPGQWFAASETLDAAGLVAALEERLSSTGATVTDLSHARTVLRLRGPAWRDLLAKGCPVDVDALGPGDCAATLLGHFAVIVHCVADDTADVYVFRSFGVSLWEWLRGGAEEFGYTVE